MMVLSKWALVAENSSSERVPDALSASNRSRLSTISPGPSELLIPRCKFTIEAVGRLGRTQSQRLNCFSCFPPVFSRTPSRYGEALRPALRPCAAPAAASGGAERQQRLPAAVLVDHK